MKLYSVVRSMVELSDKPYCQKRSYYISRENAIAYMNECIELLEKGEYKHSDIDDFGFELSRITRNHDGSPRIVRGRSFPNCLMTEIYMIELETLD